MKKKHKFKQKTVICLSLAALFFIPAVTIAQQQHSPLPLNKISTFAKVFETIKNHYVEHVTDEELLNNAIEGMIGSLDPHSAFLDRSAMTALRIDTTGRYGGLGIEVSKQNGAIRVISPLDDTPAFRAGVQPGDLIIRLDNRPVDRMTLNEAVDVMRGEPGTDITLTIIREGSAQPLRITLTRAVIRVSSVRSRLLEPHFGYLRVTQFQTNSPQLVRQQINSLYDRAASLDGMVLDLRNNPGGELRAAVGISELFVDDGIIVTTRNRDGVTEQEYKAAPGDILQNIPMVVLVNGGSASASEIVAGALQDHARAIIMGETTFGKGSVQTILTLDSDTAVKLTTHRYYTPSGRSIQGRGIVPDILVERRELELTSSASENSTIRESDLDDSLENDTEDSIEVLPAATESFGEVVGNDYQLNEALNLLKGLKISRSRRG